MDLSLDFPPFYLRGDVPDVLGLPDIRTAYRVAYGCRRASSWVREFGAPDSLRC